MADPFSSLAEGIQHGTQMGLLAKQKKLEEQKAVQAKTQTQFENTVNGIKMNAEVLSRGLGEDFSNIAGNNLLKGYRDLAKVTGIDPSSIPASFSINPERDKPFIDQIRSTIKAYEDKAIGKNDLRLNLLMIGKQWKDKTGKEPDISGLGEKVLSENDKPLTHMDVQVGDQKIPIQQSEPGSSNYTQISLNGKPISAPVPASEAAQTMVVDGLSQLDTLNQIDKLYDPKFVGPISGKVGGLKTATGIGATPDEAEFRTQVQLQGMKLRKFYLGTAQSAQELKNSLEAIPSLQMSPVQFEAALDATRKNVRGLLRQKSALGAMSGQSLPSDEQISKMSNSDLVDHKFSGKPSLDNPKYWGK